jgi:adenosylcobinamide-GDP ribazoletransferase
LLLDRRSVLAAICFLTRLPLQRGDSLGAMDLARGAVLFPIVGAGVAACVGGVGLGLRGPLGNGLADTADALGGRSRHAALRIMRDHSLGSYGASALILDLLLKASLLATLLGRADALTRIIAAGALSRAVPLPLAWALPYARAGPGSGRTLTDSLTPTRAIGGVALATAIAVGGAGPAGSLMLAATIVVAVLSGVALRGWLAGVTGDALGATIELSETVALVVAVAV